MTVYDIDVIQAIQQEQGIAPDRLAEKLGISRRTLRDRISRLNKALEGIAAISYSRRRGGYVLSVDDEGRLSAWIERRRAIVSEDPAARINSRVARLLNYLLLRTDWITIDELAKMLYVSRSCISGDLKRVEGELARFRLSIERRPHRGIRVVGPEMGRRLCLADAALHRLAVQEGVAKLFDNEFSSLLSKVADLIDTVLEQDDVAVNSLLYQNLLVHIAIAILRIRGGNYIPLESIPEPPTDTEIVSAAEHISQAVSKAFAIELPPGEVAYIAIHLAGKQVLYEGASKSDGSVITDEAWEVVGRMLEIVWKVYRFDFRNDLELRMNLARHVVPLSTRLTYHMNLVNPLLDEIKESYPLAFAMAGEAATVLADEYRYYPSEHEIGYIALGFALALERQKAEKAQSRVLVVCASGEASSHLLAYRIQQEFGAYLAGITTCNVAQVKEQDFSKIDYVFTTVPLNMTLPVPVREITLMFNEEDRDTAGRMLKGEETTESFERFVPRDLFFTHRRFADKSVAISFLCNAARSWAPAEIRDNFENLVWQREHAAPTSFGGEVAIPHPFESQTTKTFIAVAVCDEPVAWGPGDVHVIILICASKLPEARLDKFYRPLMGFINNADAVQRLINQQDYERFIEELNDG